MKALIEWAVYSLVVIGLSALIVSEGARNNALVSAVPLEGKDLLRKISKSQTRIQIVDIRPLAGDEGFDESHIPGAIPFPNCEFNETPESARKQIMGFAPTVIVSQDGNRDLYEKCRQQFKMVRNLAGGMKSWLAENRPEDSGEFTPPRASAGGGCL